MVDPRCVDYIRKNKDKYPMDTLKAALLKAGASAADIEKAVLLAVSPPPTPIPATAPPMRRSPKTFADIFPAAAPSGAAAPAQDPSPTRTIDSGPALLAQTQGLLPRARSVVLDPVDFFRTMPRSGGWQEPMVFLLTMSLAGALLRLVLGLVFGLFGSGTSIALFAGLFSIFTALIVVPIAAVVVAGITHVIWTVLGSQQPFEVSLRCIAFMSALMPIHAVVQALPVVGLWLAIAVSLYGVYLFLPASTEVHMIGRMKASVVALLFSGLALLGLLNSTFTMWKLRRMIAQRGGMIPQTRALQSLIEAGQGALPTGAAPSSGQPPATAQAMQALSSALGALGADTSIQAVMPDALKGLLPREIPDMRRTDAESGRQRLGPMEMSAATGTYESATGGKIEIQLIDAGSYSGLLSTAWDASNIDQRDETGFKRSTIYKGAKTLEEYRKAERAGSIQLIAAQRFAIKVTGRDVDMKVVRAALDTVDLDALGRLAH